MNIIKRIKQHEKKYTIILVILFVFIIILLGYLLFSIDSKNIPETINYKYSSLYISSQAVTLTNKNILKDEEGLNSKKLTINIKNTTNSKCEYRIILKKDNQTTQNCGCQNNTEDYKYIKYSLNQKDILKLEKDMVIYKGTLNKDEEKTLTINIWLDNNLNINNYHYHGYFSIEKINQD